MSKPRVLFLDIETKPLRVWVFGLFNQNIGIEQIDEDKSIISWAAKWRGESKVHQEDLRDSRILVNDKRILRPLYKLISEADIIVAHNGDSFDVKEINARLQIHGFKPPEPYKTNDTKKMAKKTARHTSNKLSYLAKAFGLKHQKSEHGKFPGFTLWLECIKGNQSAWREMAHYNRLDVLVLEELYERLIPWDGPMHSVYVGEHLCPCGSKDLKPEGHRYTATGKFQRFKCRRCGKWSVSSKNVLDKAQRQRITR